MQGNQSGTGPKRWPPLRELCSTRRKLVYLYLRVEGEATVDQLKEDLDLDVLTLYSVLPSLRDRGVLDNDGDRWFCPQRRLD